MSWCRWSSMNWQCDLYIYDDVGGYVSVHVAGRKKAWALLPDPSFMALRTKWNWLFQTKAGRIVFRAWRALWDFERLVTPWRKVPWQAGESHQFTDMKALGDWLLIAKRRGLRFPDVVWCALIESCADTAYTLTD